MIRVGQRLGKYRIVKRVAEGGYAKVYGAHDTVAGVRVAIKVPNAVLITKEALDDFRREIRSAVRRDILHFRARVLATWAACGPG